MTKNDILNEILYDVSDEIGTDISYISTNKNGYQYLTGMDFGMILAAGISSTFFIPLISAFATKIGEALADTVINGLKKISSRTQKQLKERSSDSTIIIDFINIMPGSLFSAAQFPLPDQEQKALNKKQTDAIQDFLESCSFPHEKAELLAGQICNIMNDAMADAVTEGGPEND